MPTILGVSSPPVLALLFVCGKLLRNGIFNWNRPPPGLFTRFSKNKTTALYSAGSIQSTGITIPTVSAVSVHLTRQLGSTDLLQFRP
ncbi:hypothetical protein H4582DRAFT_1305107 [Lactarius indigo]|nr:hypothetical protein H4582DRAFT_1305107 [Lactarius indigo]